MRDDKRAGTIAAAIYNVNKKAESPMIEAEDIFPELDCQRWQHLPNPKDSEAIAADHEIQAQAQAAMGFGKYTPPKLDA